MTSTGRVILRRQRPAHVLRATARFHRHDARRQPSGIGDDRLSPHAPANHHLSRRVEPDHAAAVLTQVDPQYRYFHDFRSFLTHDRLSLDNNGSVKGRAIHKGGDKGYDAGKKITGRKRHILADTDGRLLTVRVHGAHVQDRDGGKLPLKASRQRFPFVARVFADGGYTGRLVHSADDKTHITLEIIRRGVHAKGFEVLPRRWVVERTIAWIFKNRRLVRDYEQLTAVAETLITIAATVNWPPFHPDRFEPNTEA